MRVTKSGVLSTSSGTTTSPAISVTRASERSRSAALLELSLAGRASLLPRGGTGRLTRRPGTGRLARLLKDPKLTDETLVRTLYLVTFNVLETEQQQEREALEALAARRPGRGRTSPAVSMPVLVPVSTTLAPRAAPALNRAKLTYSWSICFRV